MPQYARIKLTSTNLEQLERLAQEIKDITEKTGVKIKGTAAAPNEEAQDNHSQGADRRGHAHLRPLAAEDTP